MKQFIIATLFIFLANTLLAQKLNNDSLSNDSLKKIKTERNKIYKGPRQATILSTILPGLGQVYNKKYWKVPVVYVALGSLIYLFQKNNDEYNYYRNNLIKTVKDPSLTYVNGLSQDQLQTQKLYYKKKRDFALIGIAMVYILNIIDANVDAHLKTFDVSDNLSLEIKPWFNSYTFIGTQASGGLTFKFKFKK